MDSIGFKNFRRFANFPVIDLGDISILVGGNNAGKSTLVKAILLMRDFLKSRIESVNGNAIYPQFSFDAEHVNVGDFYRAFCRQAPRKEDTISFEMRIENFFFSVNICGERKPGVIPEVKMIAIADEDKDVYFNFDFSKGEMTAKFVYDREALNSPITYDLPLSQTLEDLKKKLSNSTNLDEISRIKLEIEKTEKRLAALPKEVEIEESNSVTLNMSFLNCLNAGALLLPELIHAFVYYTDIESTGDKRSSDYRKQESDKNFLRGKAVVIKNISEKLEKILNTQVVEYIFAHSVAQTPCYSNATSSNDYATRTIHDFYRARVSSEIDEFAIIENGLKLFNIGTSLKVIPFLGDSYRVVIFDKLYPEKKKGNTGGMDLADKGMGSIQIVILLLRLATLAKKYRGQSLTVLLEEPEQNLHPAMQSKLTDLLYYVNHEFGIQFIIETHSEYLIRKSQLFVAADNKSEYENKVLFKVYYLPDDDKQPYEMIYREDGKFTNEFGPGFFDTASNLAFELF